MKYSLSKVFIFLIVLFSSNLKAQKFGLNVKGGIGLSQIGGDFLSGFNKPSYSLGLEAPYRINGRLAWITGLDFVEGGSKKDNEKAPLASSRVQLELSLRSIAVSGLMQINFGEDWEGGYNSYFRIGPTYNYQIERKIESISSIEINDSDPVFKDSFINIYFAIGKRMSQKFSLDISFAYSLTSIKKDSDKLIDLYPYALLLNFNYHIFD